MKRLIQRAAALTAALCLAAACMAPVYAETANTEKEENVYVSLARDEKSRTFSSNSKRSHILRTSSRSRRLILSSIVSFAVWLKCTRTI